VIAELEAIEEDQAFLKNLFHASDLPAPACITFLTLNKTALRTNPAQVDFLRSDRRY